MWPAAARCGPRTVSCTPTCRSRKLTVDRQRKDLGLEQVRVLQSIRDENETIRNQLDTERADILMWRDTQDLVDAESREKDEQLAKEAKSLADRRKQLDEELGLFEAQKQALQRLQDEAAKAEEARKAERVKFDREREKQATETKNQISIVVTRQEELEARTRRLENDSERLEAEQQRLSQQQSDFAKDQRIFFENRDKLLAEIKEPDRGAENPRDLPAATGRLPSGSRRQARQS